MFFESFLLRQTWIIVLGTFSLIPASGIVAQEQGATLVFRSGLADAATVLGDGAYALTADPSIPAEILRRQPHRLRSVLPLAGGHVSVNLQRFELFAPDARVLVVTAEGERRIDQAGRFVSYFGTVEEYPNSLLSINVSAGGISGVLQLGDEVYDLSTSDAAGGAYVLQPQNKQGGATALNCKTLESDLDERVLQALGDSEHTKAADRILDEDEEMTLRVAVESDYLTFSGFGSESAALDHLTAVMAGVAQLYSQQADIKIEVSYMRVWTIPQDPYQGLVSVQELLPRFQQYWRANMQSVERDVAMYLAVRRDAGAGRALRIGGVCSEEWGYLFVPILRHLFPLPTYSWDIFGSAHELGHILGAPHTHSCLWPEAPLDSCFAAEDGRCFSETVPRPGSIMSYCDLVEGGGGRMEFHERVRAVMRSFLARSSCRNHSGTPSYDYSVSGRVLADGQPQEGVKVRIVNRSERPVGTPAPGGAIEVISDDDGIYEFKQLATGYYDLEINSERHRLPADAPLAASLVFIDEQNVIHDLRVERAQLVSGGIQGLPGGAAAQVFVIPERGQILWSLDVADDGSFSGWFYAGSYVALPWLAGHRMTPQSAAIEIDASGVSGLSFTAAGLDASWQVPGIVFMRDEDLGLAPAAAQTVEFLDLARQELATTALSDDNGVFVADHLSNGFYTAQPRVNSEVQVVDAIQRIEIKDADIGVPIAVNLRNRILPAFTRQYRFSVSQGSYSEITGGVATTAQVDDEWFFYEQGWPLRFGNQEYDRINIQANGYMFIGRSVDLRQLTPLSALDAADGIIAPLGMDLMSHPDGSEIRIETLGEAPERELVVQWKNFSEYAETPLRATRLNFQLRMAEKDGSIEFVYGPMEVAAGSTLLPQVGLRGSDNLDFNNRSSGESDVWQQTKAGAQNTAACFMSAANLPPPGIRFRWTTQISGLPQAEADSPIARLRLQPNPASRKSRLNFSVNEAAPIEVLVLNILGEVVWRKQHPMLPAGPHQELLELEGLPSGSYICRIQCASYSISHVLLVSR